MRTATPYAVDSAENRRIVMSVVAIVSRGSPDDPRPEDVQASFCAALVDEWITQGVTYAAIAPGSRSTPLALALVRACDHNSNLKVDVFHDERSAAFAALGAGVVTGNPSIVLCTSGTAAAHFHAAVIEADASAVPMIVCTADRPAELRDVGAPQTIDQTKIYGHVVRWFHDPGVPVLATAPTWRSLAARALWLACGSHPGPVHLNLPFREPLVGQPIAELVHTTAHAVGVRERRQGRSRLDTASLERLALELSGRRGVIVAGRGCGDPRAVDGLAHALGWPVFAEPRSGCGNGDRTILHFDAIVRVPDVVAVLEPEIVLRLGEPPASKALVQWVSASSSKQIHVVGSGQMFDPDHRLDVRIEADVEGVIREVTEMVRPVPEVSWWEKWLACDLRVRSAIAEFANSDDAWSALWVTRDVIRHLPEGSHLVVSSSMPIRDVEWFAGNCAHVTVHANRGANGIDGVIATSVGVARMSGRPTFVLLGDVAAIHDASTLASLAGLSKSGRDLDLRVVIVNNDGGGIFHHLPQAATVEPDTFESIYGTPHGVDFAAVAQGLGIPSSTITQHSDGLREALHGRGPLLIDIRTDREGDVLAHRRLQEMIAARLRSEASAGPV